MSGIAGIYHLDGRPVKPALLARMSDSLAHRGPDGEAHRIDGPVGLSCQLMRVTPESRSETQPFFHGSGAAIVFDGRLDNRDELIASLRTSADVDRDSPDPALALAAFATFGDRFAEHLNGDFALGVFDPRRRQLILVRDAIGVRPLYYCRAGDTFLFASEIKAIIAHPDVSTRPNDEMLSAFLCGDRAQHYHGFTFFEGISSVVPAHLVVASREGVVARRYWDFDPEKRIRLGSFQEYADEFGRLFRQAVTRRLRSANPVAVSVSGGLDSSSIFCVAEHVRRQSPDRAASVVGFSYVSADGVPSDEKAFLVEIERQSRRTIERMPMGPPGFMDGAPDVVRQVEAPLLDVQRNTTADLMRAVAQRGSRVLLTGHWGDEILFDQAYLADLFCRFAWRQVVTHIGESRRWTPDVPPTAFWRQFVRGLSTLAPDMMVSPLRRFKATVTRAAIGGGWYADAFRRRPHRRGSWPADANSRWASAHFRSIYREARSRYHVLCMEWNNKVASQLGLEMAFPFLDRDLLSYLMKIPGEAQTWMGVPKALLREAMRGVLPSPLADRRGKADFTGLANAGVDRDFAQIIDGLQSVGLARRRGYVDGPALRREVARLKGQIMGTDCLAAWSLKDLIGLELWLQTFFPAEPRENEVNARCQREPNPMMPVQTTL